jgi:heterodisulfide reductase subunit A-like polyferredoxin
MALLSEARGTEAVVKEQPPEKDITEEEPRIGVFVCHCGINIASVVDVKGVAEYAETLPHVVYAGNDLFTCSQDSQEKMKELIEEHRLNRIVVSACSPKTHEPIFQDTMEACGLNKYLFEMANIRNQDSWVHSESHEKATQIPVNQKGLVIGGGVAGMNAALGLADQDFEVVLVEKEAELGGLANRLTATIEGADVSDYLDGLIKKVTDHTKIQVLTNALIISFTGSQGNFTTEILVGPQMVQRKIDHGAVIVATGANEYQPKEFLYGENPRVMTQLELAERLQKGEAGDAAKVVMIQCVGSRNEDNPNCSRICCQSAIKNALQIKKINPEADIFILYRDIRTYGLLEDYYAEARRHGILFFPFDPEDPPVVESFEDGVQVSFKDQMLDRPIKVKADLLALSAGMVAEDTEELSSILKLARNPEGFLMEAHVKLRPVDMAVRNRPQSQAPVGNHFPGLCRCCQGDHLSLPDRVDPVCRHSPG